MLKGLRHSDYERRKIASLQMEALGEFILLSYRLLETPLSLSIGFHAVRDLAQESPPDDKRIKQIISQLWDYAAPRSQEGPNNMHTRSGGMIGLAGVTCGYEEAHQSVHPKKY